MEVDADAPAHADDHRLAIHRLQAIPEVLDDVLRDEGDALLRADDGLELRPLGLQLLAAIDLLALGCLLETGVDVRLLLLVESSSLARRLS